MKQLCLKTVSILVCMLITFNLSCSSTLAEDYDDDMTPEAVVAVEQSLTLEQLESRLERVESILFEAEQPEPTEGEQEPVFPESFSPEAVNASQLRRYRDRINSWSGLPNFSGTEITNLLYNRCSTGRQNSVPPQNIWNNIGRSLAVVQRLRTDLGVPVKLTSVYRERRYNECIGGVPGSFHTSNQAIDFYAYSGTSGSWARRLKSYQGQSFTNPVDGTTFTFAGGIGIYNTFVHVDSRGYEKVFDQRT